MSREMLQAKLPYALSIQHAMNSRQKLRNLNCDYFIMAHRGICAGHEIDTLIDDNHTLILRRAFEIRDLVDEPMDFSHLCARVCKQFELFSLRPRRALYYERNIRFFIEFLVDRGEFREPDDDGGVTMENIDNIHKRFEEEKPNPASGPA